MHPFWNAIVNLYPKWLAPNVLTFTGFLCLILQHILFSIYDYSFYGYCFDRADCLSENSLNLTARQQDFQNNLDNFKQLPSNICSCIPRWLFFMIAICQFLSHHLGKFKMIIIIIFIIIIIIIIIYKNINKMVLMVSKLEERNHHHHSANYLTTV